MRNFNQFAISGKSTFFIDNDDRCNDNYCDNDNCNKIIVRFTLLMCLRFSYEKLLSVFKVFISIKQDTLAYRAIRFEASFL